jgi:hypothetical protein
VSPVKIRDSVSEVKKGKDPDQCCIEIYGPDPIIRVESVGIALLRFVVADDKGIAGFIHTSRIAKGEVPEWIVCFVAIKYISCFDGHDRGQARYWPSPTRAVMENRWSFVQGK